MNSRIYIDGHAIDPIDTAFEQWDGLPKTSREIAEAAGMNESTVRQLVLRAYRKMRENASPAVLEYAEVDDERMDK